MATDPNGGFVVNDTTGEAVTDMNTLFGVNANVGQAPILLSKGSSRVTAVGTVHETPERSSTLTQVLQGFYGMDPDALAQLQQQLYAAGFYDDSYYTGKTPKQPEFRVPDEDSFAAFKKAAVRAARSGQSLPDVLDQGMQSAADARTAQKNAVALTSPANLRQVAKEEAQSLIGRNADPGFVDNYVAAYHAAEVASSQPGADGNIVQAPDPRVFAQQMLRQQYPVDVGVNDALNVGNQLVNTLSRPAGSLGLPTSGGVNG